MNIFCWLALVYATIVLLGAMIFGCDRLTVFVMRWINLPLFPTAVAIAVSIVEHPEEWSASKYELCHPNIGTIWTANEAYGIKIETNFGTWKPNRIERRIIREAVDWRIGGYIRNRIAQTMQRRALQ